MKSSRLIIIRRIFKDLTKLEINWFDIKTNVNFTLDILAGHFIFPDFFYFISSTDKMKINQAKIQKH
jgi:hypothetical protein